MKLYYSPGACSLSPHIVLREAGLAFTPVLASTKTHKLADGTDYYTINPKGYVPLLELDDGQRLTEGPAIVQYIADQVPDKKLVAPGHDGALPPDRVAELHQHRAAQGHRRAVQPRPARRGQGHGAHQGASRLEWVNQQLEGRST